MLVLPKLVVVISNSLSSVLPNTLALADRRLGLFNLICTSLPVSLVKSALVTSLPDFISLSFLCDMAPPGDTLFLSLC